MSMFEIEDVKDTEYIYWLCEVARKSIQIELLQLVQALCHREWNVDIEP